MRNSLHPCQAFASTWNTSRDSRFPKADAAKASEKHARKWYGRQTCPEASRREYPTSSGLGKQLEQGSKVIDFHCHILPGLDDGARDWPESLDMARMAAMDGISGIVCTPHYSRVFPENRRDAITASVEELRIRLRQAGIPLDLYPGAELAIDPNLPKKIESGEVMTINDKRRVVLVEMPPEARFRPISTGSSGIYR